MKLIGLLSILCFSAPLVAQDLVPKEKENFHLFLLVGQSNMAGRGKVEPQDLVENKRVLALGEDLAWVPAVAPLHFDRDSAGVGLGKTFGLEIISKSPDITVGLIPCAVGGSSLRFWVPGKYHESTESHPWDDMVRRVQEALKVGTLKGILWHQGESDSNAKKAPQYEERMHGLVSRIRKEFEVPKIPFICGQLGQFEERPWNEYRKMVDAVHRGLPEAVPYTGFVSSDGLIHRGDQTHFDSASCRTFGKRYAVKYWKMTQ